MLNYIILTQNSDKGYVWCNSKDTNIDMAYHVYLVYYTYGYWLSFENNFYGHTIKPTARHHLFALVYAFNSLLFITFIKGLFKNVDMI